MIEEHIRFFYTNRQDLLFTKNDILKKNNNIDKMRNILQLNFCLGVPLSDLKRDALKYLKAYCTIYKRRKSFSSLEYINLLDSFFYLLATDYEFKKFDRWFVSFIECFNEKDVLDKDEFENSSKTYLRLIIDYICHGKLNNLNLIYDNKKRLGFFHEEFIGLAEKNYSTLYNVLETALINSNRMKLLYLNANNSPKSVGYQDFSSIFSILGILKFWKGIGLELDDKIINEKFVNEFKKEIVFFDF